MSETTTEVRAEIENTRARMSGAIAELERKVDVAQKVKDRPWLAVGLAFGAGIVLSASKADVKAAKVTTAATRETGGKLGSALDGVVAALIGGVTTAFHSRIDGMVKDVVTSIRGDSANGNGVNADGTSRLPIRAD
ncbi:MAG TPA: DUF3618 domain-containing protein [Gemmatimonadaceae bacterium]|nr:DUF3618 domain-containing protein [Gemmatimonadaceae bacterium]